MQRFLSILFLFCLIMIFSQEKLSCEKEYQLAKEKYELLFNDINQVNYKSLPKVIIDNIDLEKIKEKNLILYYSNVVEVDPSGVPREITECKRFYPSVSYFNEEKLWGEDNISYLQSKIKKNIVPKTSLGFVNNAKEFVRLFKTENFKKGLMTRSKEIYYPNSEKHFLYFPISSPKLIIKKSSDESDVYQNSTTLITKVTNNSSKEVTVEFIFENDSALNYTQVFNFVNDEWKLTNSK